MIALALPKVITVRSTKLRYLCIIASATILCGCGRAYHLPGHRKGILNRPPDITLQQGDRVLAISTGFYFHPTLVPAFMESSNSEIVEVEVPPRHNFGNAYLIAKRPGAAIVRYGWVPDHDAPNAGFTVTVVPK